MDHNKIDNVAQMICHANNMDFDKIGPSEQGRIKMWAESIWVYLQK